MTKWCLQIIHKQEQTGNGKKCRVSWILFYAFAPKKAFNKDLTGIYSYKSLGQTLTFAGTNSEWMFARWVSLKPLLATLSIMYTIGFHSIYSTSGSASIMISDRHGREASKEYKLC
jgi:hypothetical protein